MEYPPNAREIAIDAAARISPDLAESYGLIVEFLRNNPESSVTSRSPQRPSGSAAFIQAQAISFVRDRTARAPELPKTVPDPMVAVLMSSCFGVASHDIEAANRHHRAAMAAENSIGHMLEHYINSVAQPLGWIWCSGNTVRAIDFIRPYAHEAGRYQLLQVKNRYNSENSSSKTVRDGTPIEKWHRTEAAGTSGWDKFPDQDVARQLSDDGFRDHIQRYLFEARVARP